MWAKKKVSVIFPTYKEKNSVRQAIRDFTNNKFVDEVVVVDNNAEKGTREEVAKTKARLVHEKRQGYGHAIRRGLKEAKGELMIVAEPDGSFDGRDVVKLLAYSDDFEMVFGSRTHLPLIHKGSDMTLMKRIGDVLLAKLINILFLKYPVTDVGCTLRLTTKKAWNKIKSESKAPDGIFATEWLLVAIKNNVNFIEVPINFHPRIGKSTATATLKQRLNWGRRKFLYIVKVWFYKVTDKKLYS